MLLTIIIFICNMEKIKRNGGFVMILLVGGYIVFRVESTVELYSVSAAPLFVNYLGQMYIRCSSSLRDIFRQGENVSQEIICQRREA